MKLHQLPDDVALNQHKLKDIEILLQQPSYAALRACPACERPCSCSQSSSCTCDCGPQCEHAPAQMSSDPERYPIEAKISALVFGFNALRVCPPYWSCEGHSFPSGELFRVPQVWFYAHAMIYPKLIADYVMRLKHDKAITYPWRICLSYTDNNLDTGFCIEPDVILIKQPNLAVMQEDVKVIADNLLTGIRSIAQEYLTKFSANHARNQQD